MLLLESLPGVAELECEHIPLEKVNCDQGIENILSALRAPLSERSLYMKRLYLQEWENVSRQMNESVRSYVNRYRRVVQDLQSMQIGLEAAFSSEALGYRLLERAPLLSSGFGQNWSPTPPRCPLFRCRRWWMQVALSVRGLRARGQHRRFLRRLHWPQQGMSAQTCQVRVVSRP